MNKEQQRFIVEDETGEEHIVPSKYEVCPNCQGRGRHVNRNIDGHGITASEWANDWGDEEREHCFAGHYDVTCDECHGQCVVLVADEARMSPELQRLWQEHLDCEAESRRHAAYVARMGF